MRCCSDRTKKKTPDQSGGRLLGAFSSLCLRLFLSVATGGCRGDGEVVRTAYLRR